MAFAVGFLVGVRVGVHVAVRVGVRVLVMVGVLVHGLAFIVVALTVGEGDLVAVLIGVFTGVDVATEQGAVAEGLGVAVAAALGKVDANNIAPTRTNNATIKRLVFSRTLILNIVAS